MVGVIGYMSGGKSYFAVEQILSKLATGHVVSTNIALKCQAVTSYLSIPCIFWKQLYYYLSESPNGYHQINIEDYEQYPQGAPRGTPDYEKYLAFCFLDEASSIFDSMVHASDSNIQKVAAWARHTEKRGIRIYLLMQFESELHKRLRVHITEYVKCVNTSTVRLPLVGCGLPSLLRGISLRRTYLADAETPSGPIKAFRFDPRVYSCYDTSQIVVGTNDIQPYRSVFINYDVQKDLQFQRFFRLSFFLCFLSVFGSLLWWVL